MLQHRLQAAVRAVTQPTVRQASVEFGPPHAAVYAEALAELSDADLVACWPRLRQGPVFVDEAAQYMAGPQR